MLKKHQLLFDESDDEEMRDLLKSTASPLPSAVERSSEAEEDLVASSDCVDGVQKISPIIETTVKVTGTTLEMPVGPPITELLPKSGTETTTPLIMDDARLPSPNNLERVDTTEHPQATEGAWEDGGIGSLGATTQSQELSSG